MDIEQLKLIIEAVKGLAGDTKQVVIWYLIFIAAKQIIFYGFWVFLTVFVVPRLFKVIRDANNLPSGAVFDLKYATTRLFSNDALSSEEYRYIRNVADRVEAAGHGGVK